MASYIKEPKWKPHYKCDNYRSCMNYFKKCKHCLKEERNHKIRNVLNDKIYKNYLLKRTE